MWQQRALGSEHRGTNLSSRFVNCAALAVTLLSTWDPSSVKWGDGRSWDRCTEAEEIYVRAQHSPQSEGYEYCWPHREMSTFQSGVNSPGSSCPVWSSNTFLHWLLSLPSLLSSLRASAVTVQPSNLLLWSSESQISSLLLSLDTVTEILGGDLHLHSL